jgi:hypothetical protein
VPAGLWVVELRTLPSQLRGGKAPIFKGFEDGDGELVPAEIEAKTRGDGFSIIFGEDAQLDLFPGMGEVHLRAGAPGLWSEGTDAWLAIWLARATHWVLRKPCENLDVAFALGWRVHKLELAADFTGLTMLGRKNPLERIVVDTLG